MRLSRPVRCLAMGAVTALMLADQQPSERDIARGLDKQISMLGSIPSLRRTEAIKALSPKIIQLPPEYSVPLATNLAIDGTGETNSEGLQVITSTLVETLRRLPTESDLGTDAFEKLAELILYAHMKGSLDDSRYQTAVATLKARDRHRSLSDFKLHDLEGNEWSLKNLHGRVVLLNFWATWCPPCQAEIPDLNLVCQRFHNQGLVVLGVSEESKSTLRRFLRQNRLGFPVLLDPGGKTKSQFLVPGYPESYLFDRKGNLVAESIYQTGLEGLLDMLAQAGLKSFP